MIQKFRLLLVTNFEAVINLCLFLIVGSLIVLLSTISIEYRIVNISKEIERINYMANNAIEWGIDINNESNGNIVKNLESQQIIALLDSDESFEEKEMHLLIKTVEYGPMTFALAYDDLIANYSQDIDIDLIDKKITQNNLIIDSFLGVFNNRDKEGIRNAAIHNREESIFLSKVWFNIFNDSQERIKILEATKNELVMFSSNIVIVVFLLQLFLYFIFQLYELYSERRKK